MEQSRNDFQNGGRLSNAKYKRFETDSAKIVRRHLSDKNDVITEEDIRNVRIYTELPPFNEVTTGAEAEMLIREELQKQSSNRPGTPWDLKE